MIIDNSRVGNRDVGEEYEAIAPPRLTEGHRLHATRNSPPSMATTMGVMYGTR